MTLKSPLRKSTGLEQSSASGERSSHGAFVRCKNQDIRTLFPSSVFKRLRSPKAKRYGRSNIGLSGRSVIGRSDTSIVLHSIAVSESYDRNMHPAEPPVDTPNTYPRAFSGSIRQRARGPVLRPECAPNRPDARPNRDLSPGPREAAKSTVPPRLSVPREVIDRRLHPAGSVRHAGRAQPHFHAT